VLALICETDRYLLGWVAGWLVGSLDCWLVGQLVGWLVSC